MNSNTGLRDPYPKIDQNAYSLKTSTHGTVKVSKGGKQPITKYQHVVYCMHTLAVANISLNGTKYPLYKSKTNCPDTRNLANSMLMKSWIMEDNQNLIFYNQHNL